MERRHRHHGALAVPWLTAAALLLLCCCLPAACAELVRVDLAALRKGWSLTNANGSIVLPARVPAHTLSVLAGAGLVQADPLSRYGERDTRWVAQEGGWNFTLVWHSDRHAQLSGCRQVLLVLHGIDTVGAVVLNGGHVLAAHNAHR
jgi:beta-mannosidase